MQHARSLGGGILSLILLAACADSPTSPGTFFPESLTDRGVSRGGAALSATKTATGFFEVQREYGWTLDKRVYDILDENMRPEASTSETTILRGQVKWVHYEFTGTRTLEAIHRLTGARGEICVTNTGDAPTVGLQIMDIVQRNDGVQWVNHDSAAVSVNENPELDPGEKHCYPYETRFDATSESPFRNSARVTVTNHAGHDGEPFGPGAVLADGTRGPELRAAFTLPTVPVATTKDASATIHDTMLQTCANVFPSLICTGAGGIEPVTLTGTTTYLGASTVDFYNYVVCGQEFRVTNNATLVESGPHAPGTEPDMDSASATIIVATGDCAPPPANPGCTLTQGYWKNHAWPTHPMWGPSTLATWPDIQNWKFFDTTLEWPEVLDVSPKGDPYFILAHQYIAAILNQQNGAYVPEEVRRTLVDAYDYFSLAPAAREAFDRNQLTEWATVLDRYNNGQLGVPHCG